MLTIRLQRTGTKNQPKFRVVLAQAYRAAGKKSLEILGHYDPRRKDFGIKSPERLKYWLAQHVQVSPTVHNLLVEKKMIEAKKVKAWQPKKSGEAGSGSAGKEAVAAAATPAPTAKTEAVAAPAPEAPAAAPEATPAV